jgi:ribonuclease HII
VPEHQEALARLGPTIHHRRSFSPVAARYLAEAADPDEIISAVLPL